MSKILDFLENWHWNLKYRDYRRKYQIHPAFRFNGNGTLLSGDGKIVLGAHSYIGEHSVIQSSLGCRVKVGRFCSISHYVMIYTENLLADQDFSVSRKTRKGHVTIGDYCWIGAGVFIREGVSLGDNVVVGANAVVARSIPDFCVAAGCPARIIRRIAPSGTHPQMRSLAIAQT